MVEQQDNLQILSPFVAFVSKALFQLGLCSIHAYPRLTHVTEQYTERVSQPGAREQLVADISSLTLIIKVKLAPHWHVQFCDLVQEMGQMPRFQKVAHVIGRKLHVLSVTALGRMDSHVGAALFRLLCSDDGCDIVQTDVKLALVLTGTTTLHHGALKHIASDVAGLAPLGKPRDALQSKMLPVVVRHARCSLDEACLLLMILSKK